MIFGRRHAEFRTAPKSGYAVTVRIIHVKPLKTQYLIFTARNFVSCAIEELIKIFTGIIAEFNPLHKGHQELLRSIKADGIIVILSGNFTQRGSPAIIDKFLRAELAVNAGADLVLELPFVYACSAAQDFSRGAVEILGRLGFVDSLAFGMEEPGFDLMPLVKVMLNENESYKNFLHEELQRGASFTKANSLALEKILPGSHDFIVKPNNLLALSYALEVEKRQFNMKLIKIKRTGNFQSKIIRDGVNVFLQTGKFKQEIFDMLPEFSREKILSASRIIDEKKLWPLIQNIFIRSRADDLRKIYGVDEGIENLFLRHWRASRDLEDFIGRCVCARYTRAHIRRRLIYILLGLDRWEIFGALRRDVPYVRVLAFNGTGREILRRYGKNSGIRIITRLTEAKSKDEKFFAEIEFRASQLHELLMNEPDMKREMQTVLQF